MNKRSKEFIAGASAFLSLTAGSLAYSGSASGKSQNISRSELPQTNPLGLPQIAGQIIKLAAASRARYESKSFPFGVGFSETTTSGGEIDFSVQTYSSKYSADNVEEIEVDQSNGSSPNFDLSFSQTNNGSWDMSCVVNPFSRSSQNVDEIYYNENPAYAEVDGKTINVQSTETRAVENYETETLGTLVDSAAHHLKSGMPSS